MGYNTGERTSELVIGAFEIQDEVELIRIIQSDYLKVCLLSKI